MPAVPDQGDPVARKRLADLSAALVKLHKALIDSERIRYEQAFGTIGSPGAFLQLLTNDPWFAWLRPISELIVSIDERLDAEEPVTGATAEETLKKVRSLLVAQEVGDGFGKEYFDALQRNPDVVLAHAAIMKFGRKKG
jgi:hypothetical protein